MEQGGMVCDSVQSNLLLIFISLSEIVATHPPTHSDTQYAISENALSQ